MTILNWVLRIVAFLLLLGLAARNSDPVTLRFFFGQAWHVELSLVLFLLFLIGAVFGLAAGWSIAQRRPTRPHDDAAD